MTVDIETGLLKQHRQYSSFANVTRRFTSLVALHWKGWFFFYKKSQRRMLVWSAIHAMGFKQGRFGQLKNATPWHWWFGELARAVKCRQLLPNKSKAYSDVYFLNEVDGRQLGRNWRIFESGTKQDQLIIQCLEYESSRVVLQARGRQYQYWGRRPESGIVVSGKDRAKKMRALKKTTLPLPLDYHKQAIAAQVRLLLARARTMFRTSRSVRRSSRHQCQAEKNFFHRICSLGEGVDHIFKTVMRYFNPLQNLTFISSSTRATPIVRSGGLCTSIIRHSTKRNRTCKTEGTDSIANKKNKRTRLRIDKSLDKIKRPSDYPCVEPSQKYKKWLNNQSKLVLSR